MILTINQKNKKKVRRKGFKYKREENCISRFFINIKNNRNAMFLREERYIEKDKDKINLIENKINEIF